MADLNELQASQAVKIVGSDSSGLETNAVGADSENNLLVTRKDRLGTGTITALNGTVTVNTQGCSTVIATITGTWVATIIGEGTVDGVTWVPVSGVDLNTNLNITSGFTNTSAVMTCAGFAQIRLRASTFTSGTVEVAYDASSGVHSLGISYGNNNTPLPGQSQLVGGTDGANLVPLLVDAQGRLITSAITGFGSDFAFGDVTTSSITKTIIRRTAYVEQTSDAQRSIVSNNINDTAAGTGARTVSITYLDSTGAGPFVETITLNGTTPVNTVATNICFIEQMEVLTAGSTLSNVGIISLKAATAGGGVTIGTMAATDNQTFWAHHYIAIGKECNITGISCGHNGTTVGSGGLFIISARLIGVTNAIERQISDFVRLYGQSSTFSRNYTSPVKVSGPARLFAYVTPETSSSTIYRCAVDFFEP